MTIVMVFITAASLLFMISIWILRIRKMIIELSKGKFIEFFKLLLTVSIDISIFMLTLLIVGKTMFGLQVSAILNVTTSFLIKSLLFKK
ncbi:hypothetical protein OSSY52_18660 [Tepiditoga spiralis]|uniref:Uncharacterized protein n=1 Tax=Tepiditoga spiralis TaxID=2108365 RepID=A0A7G1G6D2_9BACT|nr:hypothetical protein [Tepiditoga spiralis]BBE31725.1 hypothetical protein OSSY52_18660 [Tepiditoga spiralis]